MDEADPWRPHALAHGVVTKSGASYSMEGERLGVGFDAVKEKLKEDKKLLQEMKQKVKGVAK